MRILILAVMLLPSSGFAADYVPPPNRLAMWTEPVDCKPKRFQLPYDLKIMCQRPKLHRENLQVYKLFENVLARYKGQDRQAFMGGQFFWKRDFAQCQNLRTADAIATCQEDQMDRRLGFLERLKANPTLLRSTVADYKYPDPWYVRLFPKQYEGKEIKLFNFLLRKDSPICANPSKSLSGHLKEYLSPDSLTAEFSGTDSIINGPDSIIKEACDADYSTTDWHGVVKLDGQGKPYLYITEVGLVHLPGSK